MGLWTFFYHNKKLNNTNYESKTTTNVETDTHSLRSSSFFFVLLLLLLLPPLGLSVCFFLSLLPVWTKFYDGGVSFFTLFASKILPVLSSWILFTILESHTYM